MELTIDKPRKPRKKLKETNGTAVFLFLGPTLLFLAIFFLFPLIATIYLSFHQWDLLGPALDAPFSGWDNYKILMSDGRFLKALTNTFLFVLANLIFMPLLALGIAYLLNEVKVMAWFWRLLFFLPVITSAVAMSLVWQYIFDPTYGPLNELLKAFGLAPQGWIMSTKLSLISVVIVSLWQGIGYHAIIYLAGLQGISEDYYEAAKIDGAGAWRRFLSITIPLLKPTSVFVLVMVAINAFQAFTQFYVMTNGGPMDSSNVLGLYIYQTAFDFLNMGKAASMSVIMFVLVIAFSFVQFKMMRQQEE
ncbi:carbohydrate ABC transporter permease [Cohnella herbarum]|uniref:Sugar ABC transporter permease n=1 Tax=Cohnella herbarum TaxID=2728023 RepID=A0A7Z2ZPE3_9BACL|nr:sugar ABC transporter permease [Cohnella herbarum]QJD85912.1 sugar ABC transporter permease [Cohnella herbarum]